MNAREMLALLGGMSRDQLERMIVMMAATAPDDFEMALRNLDWVESGDTDRPDPIRVD